MVITWPSGQGCRRVEDMLNRVNGDRRIFADKVEDAFDAQKAFAAHLGKNLRPGDKRIPMQWFIKGNAE